MSVGLSNNNLISQTATNYQNKQESKTQQNVKKQIKPQPDSYTPTSKQTKSNKKAIITNCISGAVLVGLFFLPEILMARKAKKINNVLEQAANFRPLIGNTITHQSQQYLSNGRIKTTLENVTGRFKYNEILIMKKGRPPKRIIMQKEEMPNGKYILREMKVYEGSEIFDNTKLEQNEQKYLKKHYQRKGLHRNEYMVTVKTPTSEAKSKYFTTRNGEAILQIKETNDCKENTLFLYNGDKCVGLDTQIVPKDSSISSYNMVTIPKDNLYKQKYNPEQGGIPYDTKLKTKFIQNF